MKKFFLFLAFIICIISANAQSPTINSFSPSTGAVGTLVTITGTNLGSPTALSIGGVTAIVVSNTGTTLVALVMPGAATGVVSVTTANGTVASSGSFTLQQTPYPIQQQGSKLVGTGTTSWLEEQGFSVSVSADGNTAIVGGWDDNNYTGAAWIFTRSSGTWTQQGSKLVGTGSKDSAYQGVSVSISADGNTAIVGGYKDNGGIGAVWVFTRTAGIWTQQGSKLVGTGAIGGAAQGSSVSISADGNTAIIGGQADNSAAGAAWIFTRSAGVWTQQGSKLVGTGAINGTYGAHQGFSVSISADGNTAIVGGLIDNNEIGAAWVYIRSGGTWTQQGGKLVGTGVATVGGTAADQGCSVSVSADGNTAIVGGYKDNYSAGAIWIFTRSAGIWTQQGSKLVGIGAIGSAAQGTSVSISADGNTAIVGGSEDNGAAGAAWIYTRSAGIWTQQGTKLTGGGTTGTALQGGSVSISADGNTSIVGGYYDNSGIGAAWIFASDSTEGIKNISNQNSFILYPNPSNGLFTIESGQLPMDNEKTQVEVYNVLGEKIPVQLTMGNGHWTINLSDQTSGIYFYKIVSKKGEYIASGKLIIQK